VLALLVVPFVAHPAIATAGTSTPNVAKIDAFVRAQVERHGIPGLAVALVDGDRIIHLQGYGAADGSGRAVTPQTPFVIASASKPVTALAVMQLVEAGKVELDTPVQRYLPEFRVADPVASAQITVRHLLLHTTGIPATECDTRGGARTLEQFVAELQTITLDAAPGARHYYCSGNYNVLGRIIEVVSGQTFGDYMHQHVFTPLAMRHTFTSEQEARADGLAQNYRWLFGLRVPYQFPFSPPQVPSGFMISSAEDMAHFLLALLNGGRFGSNTLLSPDGIAAMQTQSVSEGSGGGRYGLGLISDRIAGVPVVFHDGGHPNARTLVFFEPQTRRGAVLLLNSFGTLADFTAFAEIKAGVVRMLAGLEPAPASSMSLPTLYLIVDAVLGGLFALTLWPLLRLRRWEQWLRQQSLTRRVSLARLGLRVGLEIAVPLTLLIGARLFLHGMGAQSWAEGFWLFPDLGAWLWALSLVMLLTGMTRLVLLLRLQRRDDREIAGRTAAADPQPS